jgi:hypothetical protein
MDEPKKEWVTDSDKAEGGQEVPEDDKSNPQIFKIMTSRGGVKVFPG